MRSNCCSNMLCNTKINHGRVSKRRVKSNSAQRHFFNQNFQRQHKLCFSSESDFSCDKKKLISIFTNLFRRRSKMFGRCFLCLFIASKAAALLKNTNGKYKFYTLYYQMTERFKLTGHNFSKNTLIFFACTS